MNGARAPEGKNGKLLDVLAAFDGMNARSRRHALVGELMNAPCGFGHLEIERLADPFHKGAPRAVGIQRHLAAEEELRIEIAENEIRIRHGRLGATQSVADGAWLRARASAADLQAAKSIHLRDRATACPDLDHLDGGDLHRQAATLLELILPVDLEFRRNERLAIGDHASLGGGSPHVER